MARRTLADLTSGADALIESIDAPPALRTRLAAQGLTPGTWLHVVQRFPAFVVELGETTIAVERKVAELVVLGDDPDASA